MLEEKELGRNAVYGAVCLFLPTKKVTGNAGHLSLGLKSGGGVEGAPWIIQIRPSLPLRLVRCNGLLYTNGMDWIITPPDAGQRLDIFLVARDATTSRAEWQRAIRGGQIQVNGKTVKPGYVLRAGNRVTGTLLTAARESGSASELERMITVPILYENDRVVVIDKPAGVEVHPGQVPGQPTITAWLAQRVPAVRDVGEDPSRPGVVHRLDKDTSGVLVLAKTQAAWADLKQQWQRHHVQKEYVALVFGVPGGKDGRIAQPLTRSPRNPLRRTVDPTGKSAITEWKILETFGGKFALLALSPLTGRTHQLRAHLHWLGYPIVGDHLYTFKRQRPPAAVSRQLLHAQSLTLRLPGGSRRTFTAPLPPDFVEVLTHLRTDV